MIKTNEEIYILHVFMLCWKVLQVIRSLRNLWKWSKSRKESTDTIRKKKKKKKQNTRALYGRKCIQVEERDREVVPWKSDCVVIYQKQR